MHNTELVRHWRNKKNLEKKLAQQKRMLTMIQDRILATMKILNYVSQVDMVWKGIAFRVGKTATKTAYTLTAPDPTQPYHAAHIDYSDASSYHPTVILFENGETVYYVPWNPKAANNIALNWVAYGKKPKGKGGK